MELVKKREVVAIYKNANISPKKLIVCRKFILKSRNRGYHSINTSLMLLASLRKKGSKYLIDVINSALANAKHNYNIPGMNSLNIFSINIGPGRIFKRASFRAKGATHFTIRRYSNIRVVLKALA